MDNISKTKEAFSLIVTIADAIVSLHKVWVEIAPEIKRIVNNLVEQCKKVSNEKAQLNNELE